MAEHAPTNWESDHFGRILSADGQTVAFYVNPADAALIVRAVNAYQPLVDAKAASADLAKDVLLWMDNTDATAQFEAIGDRFYAETGFLRPGKSVPIDMCGAYQDEQRLTAWRLWCEAWRQGLITKARALLAQIDQEGTQPK